jgi:hypothetical protein
MDVSRCLWELLFRHECVVLPGFGGFITHDCEAGFRSDTYTFYPARREVSFNRSLQQNDGLLVIQYARRAVVGYPEAKNSVAAFIADLNRRLQSGECVELEGIGRLTMDTEQNLQFEPALSANFLMRSYGLAPFQFKPLEKEIGTVGPVRIPEAKPSYKKYRKWLVTIPVALAFALFIPPNVSKFQNSANLNPLPSLKIKPAILVSPVRADTTKYAQPADNSPKEEKVQPVKSVSDSESFFIIGGSMPGLNGAEIICNDFQKRGYEATIIKCDDHRYRVSLFATNNYHEAIQKLMEIRDKESNPQIWLFKK